MLKRAFQRLLSRKDNGIHASKPNATGIYLEITDKCNMACPMCITRNHREDLEKHLLTREDIVNKILVPSKRLGINAIAISGGEPTLSKNLLYVIDQALCNDFAVFLAINGLKDDVDLYRTILLRLNSPKHTINISFDSIDKEEMNSIRGADVYDKVVENIRAIMKLKSVHNIKTNFSAAIIIQESNMNSVTATVKFLIELGFNVIVQPRHNYYDVDIHNFRNQPFIDYSQQVKQKLLEISEELFEQSCHDQRLRITGEAQENWVKYYTNPLSISGPCKSTNMIYIDVCGNIRGCISGKIISNINSIDLKTYLHSVEYREFLNFSKICKICIHGCS